jgi:hypothetical protein
MGFVGVITSVSTARLPGEVANVTEAQQQSQWAVRRPLLGTFLGKETFASLSIENFSPTSVDAGLANSSAHPDEPAVSTANFILLAVQEQRIEKSQILTTFGTSYAYFFGEQPRQLEVSALLLNAPNFRWDLEWLYNYENFLRGSRLTSTNTVATFVYDNCIVRGYLTACNVGKTAENPKGVPLNFSLFVLDAYIDESVAKSRRAVEREQTFTPDYGELLPASQGYADLTGFTVRADRATTAATAYAWSNPLEYVAGHYNKTVTAPREAPTPTPVPTVPTLPPANFETAPISTLIAITQPTAVATDTGTTRLIPAASTRDLAPGQTVLRSGQSTLTLSIPEAPPPTIPDKDIPTPPPPDDPAFLEYG